MAWDMTSHRMARLTLSPRRFHVRMRTFHDSTRRLSNFNQPDQGARLLLSAAIHEAIIVIVFFALGCTTPFPVTDRRSTVRSALGAPRFISRDV